LGEADVGGSAMCAGAAIINVKPGCDFPRALIYQARDRVRHSEGPPAGARSSAVSAVLTFRPGESMKRRIRVTRLLLWLCVFAFVAPGFAGQAQKPQDNEEARDFKTFTDRVQAYVKMQKSLEASLPTLKPTKDAAQIVEHQHTLARKIADARRDARQGDIFTHEASERFRKIIHQAFEGPEGHRLRRTIQQDTPFKVVTMHVNDVFLDDIPLTTTPPTLMLKLPELPPELSYRFVGRDLVLKDIKAGLVVDVIPNAIP
jgi:hypothetical protein